VAILAADLRAIISSIKQATDLRQVIPDLKRSGSAMMCVCPFHADKDPSMQVNKEYYYCHSCGASGDIITWYEKSTGVDWNTALMMAGGLAGVDIGDDVKEAVSKAIKERDEREEELYHYRQALDEERIPKEYLAQRNIKPETIERFKLGYRRDWNAIAIPIFGRGGQLDAISYRYIDPNNDKRYHHKNNEMWTKGDALYNVQCLEVEEGAVCVCEGMFDVLTVYQSGHTKVVGTMGARLSDAHIKELRGAPVVFVPDCKTEHDFELFKQSVFRLRYAHPDMPVKVALLPEGDANSQGEDVVRRVLSQAQTAEFAILNHDLAKCVERDQEYRVARKITEIVKDPLTRDDIICWLAERWEKDRSVVKAALDRSDSGTTKIVTVREAIRELVEEEYAAAASNLGMGWSCIRTHIDRPHTKQIAVFAGRASVGKTMWSLNLLHKTKEDCTPTLFVTQEQPASELMARLILMATSEHGIGAMGKKDLHKAILENDSKFLYLKEYMPMAYPHLVFSTKAVTPEGLNDAIIDASNALGEAIKVVMVDYVGLMKHASNRSMSPYERVSSIMTDTQQVIKERNVFGLLLSQVGRGAGGDGTEPLGIDAMKDSSAIEEVADYVITAWIDKQSKKFEDTIGKRKMCGRVCKNRHGSMGDFEMMMDKRTLVLTEQMVEIPERHGYEVEDKEDVDVDYDGVVQ
jgi:replicative DNA helicase